MESTHTSLIQISTLLPWGEVKEVNTRVGPRLLQKAGATNEFFALWRQHGEELRRGGISVVKRAGKWEACWWRPLPDKVVKERNASIEASWAQDSTVEIPHNGGMEYLGYQKAGVAFALRKLKGGDARPSRGNSETQGVLIADEMG